MAHRHATPRIKHTRNSTFRSKIREELICGICLDFLDEPKVLSCAHSFCFACLKQTTQSRYKHGELKKGELECPSCRQITQLPPGSVKALCTNHTLKRLVDLVSDAEKNAARLLLSSRSQSVIQTINCPQHLRPVEFFCQDCNELLCPKCTSSTHRGHNFDDIDKVLPQQIQTLRSLIQPACEVANRAEGMIEHLFKTKEAITDNAHSTTEVIDTYFKKVRKTIDLRESALKSTVRKYSDIKLSRLDSHYQILQKHHDTILVKVAELEGLIDNNDLPKLFLQKQALSEDIEAKEQSVMAVGELLEESSNRSSLIFREGQLSSIFSEIGMLNERQQKPNSPFVTLRRLIVSEDEDPYLDVPLKFDDEQDQPPQQQVRVDETKSSIEYEPEGKPSNPNSSLYDVPQPMTRPRQEFIIPAVPPRKSSGMSLKAPPPPLPTSIHRSRRPTPSSASRPPHKVLTGWDDDYQNYDPTSFDHENYTPDIADKKISNTLPSRYHRSSSTPTGMTIIKNSSDEEDYDPMDDFPIPQPKPRTKPPPIPADHPNRSPRPKPKPRKVNSVDEPSINPRKVEPGAKKRSLTLAEPSWIMKHSTSLSQESLSQDSLQSPLLPPKETTTPILPIKIINNQMLSSKSKQEVVYPNGVCCFVKSSGYLVVTDVFNHCLRVLDSDGDFLERIGEEGRAGGQFKEPTAIAIDSYDNLYVTERDNPRVQKFSASGKYLTKFGQKTLLGSQLGDPMGIAITSDNKILITDWDKNEIIRFSNVGKLEKIGKENNLLKFPAGLAITDKGNMLVTDRGNHCIWEITICGDVVQRIGSKGKLPGQLLFPYGVIVLANRSIVVTESGNNRISIFSESGTFVRCFGEKGSGPGQFDHPRYLCVDCFGRVVVVDQMNQRLQLFNVG